MKALAVFYVVIFLTGASAFARMERSALQDPIAAMPLLVLLGAIIAAARVASGRRTARPPIEFDEAPSTTQRLGLNT